MKCLIVNAKPLTYKDKTTGEVVPAIVLEVVTKNLSNSSGRGTTQLFIGRLYQESLYNILLAACNGKLENFNNALASVEFDDKKNIVDFSFVETKEPAVEWRF